MARLVGSANAIRPVDQGSRPAQPRAIQGGQSFQSVLQSTLQAPGVKLSAHAAERLRTRQIDLSPDRMRRLEEGMAKAAQKGSKESLVLMDDIALVVSIRNKVVITAANGGELKDSVFTNIDSAVIV